jgi:tRNA (guanine37-N1)-methyltransferase
MRIDVITVHPGMFSSFLEHGIVKKALQKGEVKIEIHNLRDYATNRYRQVDDYQYGGGAGMVLMPEPLAKCIEHLKKKISYDEIIYLTPDAPEVLSQKVSNRLSLQKKLLIIAGHYKGIDERIRKLYVTKEISIGDYVLTGGEIPAMVLMDSIIRLIPGVLGNETSALTDSFQDQLLGYPVYTRPEEFKGEKVPPVLLSGDQKKIEEWRLQKAYEKTEKNRPDLLNRKK